MIVKKIWMAHGLGGTPSWQMQGWYLFGIIPLYIRDVAPRGRKLVRRA